VSNLGDGIALAAGPLLVASQTDSPVLVAMAALLQRLPWLLFGLPAGVIADRLDRRTIVVTANVMRAAVLAVLAVTIASDAVNVAVVLTTMFVLGTAEAFADITTGTLVPMVVAADDLTLANARLTFGTITLNHLSGPPLGAFLFAVGMAWPSAAQAVTCGLAAVLVGRLASSTPARAEGRQRPTHEIAEGARWLWRHGPIRTLTLTVTAFNITFGAAIAILVLYARERLGADEIGFGLITTASAVGGVIGTVAYTRLERSIGMANIMRAGLIIETLTHLTLATTRSLAMVLVVFTVFGAHEAAWGTTVVTVRQRAVPEELQGRVGSVYMVGLMGALVIGNALGGVIADMWGITAPFWFAFVGSTLILLTIWRQLATITRTPTIGRPVVAT
jgi:predicted MFS family arabinose efflux permease